MRHGSLFSGIDAFAIALAQFGAKTVWQSETDEYCVKILEKRWPEAEQVGDISKFLAGEVTPEEVARMRVSVLTGGF